MSAWINFVLVEELCEILGPCRRGSVLTVWQAALTDVWSVQISALINLPVREADLKGPEPLRHSFNTTTVLMEFCRLENYSCHWRTPTSQLKTWLSFLSLNSHVCFSLTLSLTSSLSPLKSFCQSVFLPFSFFPSPSLTPSLSQVRHASAHLVPFLSCCLPVRFRLES